MKRRIREAIVGVSAIILLALGVPLAVVVHRAVIDGEVVELQAAAATALAEIEVPIRPAQLAKVATEPDAPGRFAVYDSTGTKVYGRGPQRADATVEQALGGETSSSVDREIVVATPILEPGTETVTGALRLTESMSDADHRSRTAWLVMAAAGIAALGLAWLIGTRLARILADPLAELAERAVALGDGEQFEAPAASGIDEIDELSAVLVQRSRTVQDAWQRERQFSADVSHQLRTPITALRLKLEAGADGRLDPAAIDGALADVDRLETTIEHLLAVARDSIPASEAIALDEAVDDVVARWQPRATAVGRRLTGRSDAATVHAHRSSIDEVLDVLIDNALRHGTGAITVSIRHVTGGVAVDVADEGASIGLLDAERVFDRGHGTGEGQGIGLDVARSIAEAEGARLQLTHHRPTTFSLLLVDRTPDRPIDGPS